MRILHVDPATTWRGGERQVFLQARELMHRGHDCTVAASPETPLALRAAAASLPVFPLAMRGDLDAGAIAALVRRLRRDRPHVLHLHTARAHAVGGIAARLAGMRPVLVTRRVELIPRGAASRWKYRSLADHYVAISDAVADSLRAAGVAEERITRIPSGIELPREPLRRVRAPGTPAVVGTLGAFTDQKDPPTWIDVVRRLAAGNADIEFVWWGEGPFRGSLQEIANRENLGTRIDLSGFHEQLDPFWRRCDVFFLPSRFEALGTVLLDAMAHGIPIVASRVGGIPEVVRNEREGILKEPGDAAGFADAILSLVSGPDRARALGDAGAVRARDFDIRGVVDQIEELYARLRSPAARAAEGGG